MISSHDHSVVLISCLALSVLGVERFHVWRLDIYVVANVVNDLVHLTSVEGVSRFYLALVNVILASVDQRLETDHVTVGGRGVLDQ